MPTSKLSAVQIAEAHLLAAIRVWHEEIYVPAVTLAGAAEEILGKRLRKLGREPSFDNLKAAILSLARRRGDLEPGADKLIADLMNQTKNELKHYSGDEWLKFDLREDASELIDRAISNYVMLTNNALPEMASFWGAQSDT